MPLRRTHAAPLPRSAESSGLVWSRSNNKGARAIVTDHGLQLEKRDKRRTAGDGFGPDAS